MNHKLYISFQRTIFAHSGPLREAFGWFVMSFAIIFTVKAACHVSPRMAAYAKPNLKNVTF